MLSVFRWVAGAFSAAPFPPADVWRLVAAAVLTRRSELRALAGFFLSNAPLAIERRSPRRGGGANPFDDIRWVLAALPPSAGDPQALASSKSEPAAALSCLYLELSDVVSHAVWHDSCAGIPRVQLEVARKLVRSNPTVRVLGLHRKKWFDLRPLIEEAEGDVDAIFRLFKETFADFRWTQGGALAYLKQRRRRACLERRSRMPELNAGDALFVGGAFWINEEIINLSKEAVARRANLIVLIHDLVPLIAPYYTGHDFRTEYIEMLRLPAHFIVTTERNRRDLEAVRQGANAAFLSTCSSVIPLADEFPGAKRNARPPMASNRLARLAGEDFVLCVGTIEVRKNHLTLLSVWEELAEELHGRLPRLVIAGRRGWKAEAALAKLDAAETCGALIALVEAPTDDELRWLYASCSFTVFPSYFEGWGLPVGESFWFGKPCAASNASSIPTVGRDLCSYFSPFDPSEMKKAIGALLDAQTRESFQARIESTPLRTWSEVARDVEAAIIERRPPSERIPSQPF